LRLREKNYFYLFGRSWPDFLGQSNLPWSASDRFEIIAILICKI
jgi:hypothetical protein